MIKSSRASCFLDKVKESETDMEANILYDTSNMLIIWRQIARHEDWMEHLKVSKDSGDTWETPPGEDYTKWNWTGWLFEWKK